MRGSKYWAETGDLPSQYDTAHDPVVASIVISGFTAAIASSLTVSRLDNRVSALADLGRTRTGVIADGSGQSHPREHGIASVPFDTLEAAIDALSQGDIDAVFHDTPVLAYNLVNTDQANAELLPHTFGRQDDAIALPTQSAYREPINQCLLAYLDSPEWEALQQEYVGSVPSGSSL